MLVIDSKQCTSPLWCLPLSSKILLNRRTLIASARQLGLVSAVCLVAGLRPETGSALSWFQSATTPLDAAKFYTLTIKSISYAFVEGRWFFGTSSCKIGSCCKFYPQCSRHCCFRSAPCSSVGLVSTASQDKYTLRVCKRTAQTSFCCIYSL